MKRRVPGNNNFVTERVEEDQIKFLSGIRDNTIMGDLLSLIIENKNANSTEYKEINGIPRLSHVDFSATKKYGEYIQLEGGGHFSGRLTAVITAFGGIAKQLLETNIIHVLAHLYRGGLKGLTKLYNKRNPIYLQESDIVINNNDEIESAINEVLSVYEKIIDN